jgi:hypothetical protein
MAEAGIPGYEVSSWHGLFVPARTPPEIVRKISVDTIAALADPVIKSKLEQAGYMVVGSMSFKLSSNRKSINGAPSSRRSGSRSIRARTHKPSSLTKPWLAQGPLSPTGSAKADIPDGPLSADFVAKVITERCAATTPSDASGLAQKIA